VRRAVLALAWVLLASSCGGAYADRNTVVPMAIALPGQAPQQNFERLLRITRALGYHVDFADVRYGVIGTHTRSQLAGRDGAATFVVQLYTDRTATLTVLGGTPVEGNRTRVSDRVRAEAVRFAQALESDGAP
jgi:hypothetical protein